MKRIPKSFSFGPYEITVKLVSLSEMEALDDEAPLGLWMRDIGTIYVQRCRKGFNKSQQLHCFWHEFMHGVFETLGYDKLSANEQLVDQCGLLLLQAHQTFKH